MDFVYVPIIAVHLLLANVAALGPFYAFVFELRQSYGPDPSAEAPGRWIAWASIFAGMLAAVLGAVGLFMLLSAGNPFYEKAFLHVPSRGALYGVPERIWSGLAEVLVFLLTQWWAVCTWNLWRDAGGWKRFWGRALHRGLTLFSGSNVLYHLPVLFAVISVSSTRPEWQTESAPKFWRMMLDAEVASRVLHTTLAAVSVVGTLLSLVSLVDDRPGWKRACTAGAIAAAVATSLNWIGGFLVYFTLPARSSEKLLGGGAVESGLLAASLVSSLWLTQTQWQAACGDHRRSTLLRAAALLAATVLLMTAVRQGARAAAWAAL